MAGWPTWRVFDKCQDRNPTFVWDSRREFVDPRAQGVISSQNAYMTREFCPMQFGLATNYRLVSKEKAPVIFMPKRRRGTAARL
jgi:hypothetical protein